MQSFGHYDALLAWYLCCRECSMPVCLRIVAGHSRDHLHQRGWAPHCCLKLSYAGGQLARPHLSYATHPNHLPTSRHPLPSFSPLLQLPIEFRDCISYLRSSFIPAQAELSHQYRHIASGPVPVQRSDCVPQFIKYLRLTPPRKSVSHALHPGHLRLTYAARVHFASDVKC